MQRLRRMTIPLTLALALLASGGCVLAAVAVGAGAAFGAIQYTKNEAYRDFHASLDTTWRATLASMRDNGYPVSDLASPGVTEGRIEIADAVVNVERMPGDATRVRIRIGAFDNEEHRRRAGLILESIGKRLD